MSTVPAQGQALVVQTVMIDLNEVLLVDDDPADALLVKEAFRECCADVQLHHATDGEAALRWLELRHEAGLPTPAVITDLNMPTMDGFEFMERLRRDPRWQDAMLLVLSHSKRAADRERAFALGAAAYLAKAPDLDDFFTMMKCVYENWLKEEKRPRPQVTPWISLP